jgi:hypothetical protein
MKFISIILFGLLLGGCLNSSSLTPVQPDNLISEKEFKTIYSEMLISEMLIQSKISSIYETNSISNKKGNEILKNHHVDSLQYANSFEYYASNKDVMEKLYNEIINDFNLTISNIK